MQIGPLSITWGQKALPRTLSGVDSRGGWWPIIREAVAGDWQSNVEVEIADVLTYAPVFACLSLISGDIGKMTLRLMKETRDGIFLPFESPSFSPVLRRPNRYQTPAQFLEHWILVKLIHGNAYILKQRDNRQIVTALYVLDATRVRPLVADDGSVYYQLQNDNLSGLMSAVTVPATEIIHDRHSTLYHPLVGVSPISAAGVAAVLALRIQENAAIFFGNGSQPGGILTAPGHISKETAERVKDKWDTNFTGANAGKVAVLGDGMKYEPMSVNAKDSELIQQLKWTAEEACTAFGVPPYKINVGPPPNYNNIEALDVQYYSQCLQRHANGIELGLGFGLGLLPDTQGGRYKIELDKDDLFEMDTQTKMNVVEAGIRAGLMAPNEGRRRFNLPPVKGGDTPYMQQQDYSLEALSRRDEQAASVTPGFDLDDDVGPGAEEEADEQDEERAVLYLRLKAAEMGYAA